MLLVKLSEWRKQRRKLKIQHERREGRKKSLEKSWRLHEWMESELTD